MGVAQVAGKTLASQPRPPERMAHSDSSEQMVLFEMWPSSLGVHQAGEGGLSGQTLTLPDPRLRLLLAMAEARRRITAGIDRTECSNQPCERPAVLRPDGRPRRDGLCAACSKRQARRRMKRTGCLMAACGGKHKAHGYCASHEAMQRRGAQL